MSTFAWTTSWCSWCRVTLPTRAGTWRTRARRFGARSEEGVRRMLDNLQSVDPKVLERIAKLLNITEERGATEAEALNAAERAKRMMDDHGLSTAQVEAAGGVGER